MLFLGNYVKIKNYTRYEGKIGKIKGYDGFKYYKIELLDLKIEISCMENQLEKIPEEIIKKNEIYIEFEDGDKIILRDQDLRLTCYWLSSNIFFKGLYALGKYYPSEEYPEKHNSDYFTQMIINIKKGNRFAAEDIAKIYLYFIEKSIKLKEIVSKIDYIVMMPTTRDSNHVKLWGEIICKKLKKEDISDFVQISPEKRDSLKYYKKKLAKERTRIIRNAFKISKTEEDLPSLKEKKCLILDDICTTGNKINELSNTLADEGVNEVYAFVIGKTKY